MNATIALSVDENRPSRPWRFRELSTADWISAGTSIFIILNGLSVWVGWWTQSRIMVQFFADDAPTHFNTALGFILLGLGELGLVLHRRGLVFLAAGALMFIAGAELAEWVLGADLGIDTLFVVPFLDADYLHPGRMSGNTVACFLLVSGAQLIISKSGRDASGAITAAVVLKSIAGGIAFIALLGYVVELKSAYGWSASVGMGVRSWAGFLLIVIAGIAARWKHDIWDQPMLPNWFLPYLGTTVISISLGTIWVFHAPGVMPFSVDPTYAPSARRMTVAIELCMGALIVLGAISVLVARRKASMALQHADELGLEVLKRTAAEVELMSNNQSLLEQAKILDLAQVLVRDPQGRITCWSRGAEKLYGYTREEALGTIAHELLSTRFPMPLENIAAQLERTGVWEGELSQRTLGGGQIDVASVWVMDHDAPGRPGRILESNTDVTDRRRAEQKLGAQLGRHHLLNAITRAIGERQDLSSIFQVVIGALEDQLPIDFGCLCIYQPPGVLVIAGVSPKNRGLAAELGLSEQVQVPIDQNGLSRCVLGKLLVYEPDLKSVQFPFPQRLVAGGLSAMVAAPLLVENKVFGVLIAARRGTNSFSSGECKFLGQLSEHVALAAHHIQLYGALEVAYEDLRQTQQAVMRQEKLRVLGQMASGIAHDINNALSPAALYVELLLERTSGQSSEAKGCLEIIRRAIEGVAQTVARMKEFYSDHDPQLAHDSVSLNRVFERVVDLTRARWNAMQQESGVVIVVKTEFASDLPAIIGNESEIRDALTNLILNAVDAMPQGGQITLRSCAIGSDQVQLEVTDTGIGMDEATRNRCVEPFYTTKGARGTGLGLAMVYGTIERHRGEMQIESAPGAGTNIRLIFPAAPIVSELNSTMRTEFRPQQPLRILLIDDDPIILKSLRDTLEGDGHFVEAADGGQRGIDAFRAENERGEPFAAVITDLGMPQIDGRAVANAIKSMRSETSVILLTGWGHRMLAENDMPKNVDRVLSKPPKLAILRCTLAELTTAVPT